MLHRVSANVLDWIPFSGKAKTAPSRSVLRTVACLVSVLVICVYVMRSAAFVFTTCYSDRTPLMLGPDVDAKMLVSHGTSCTLWAPATAALVKDVRVTDEPRHGTVTLRGQTGVIYHPARFFKGNDYFAFSLTGSSGFFQGTTTYRVNVTVQ